MNDGCISSLYNVSPLGHGMFCTYNFRNDLEGLQSLIPLILLYLSQLFVSYFVLSVCADI